MPYQGERATGDSLWRLEENESVKAFKGMIRTRDPLGPHELPVTISPPRHQRPIRRIIAIDGSTVTKAVQNGFPKAEAALFNAAVILVKTDELTRFDRDYIPSPQQMRDLEKAYAMSAVLPGQNVVGKSPAEDTPKKFFRATIRQELNFRLDPSHESLLETFLAITKGAANVQRQLQCPIEDCERAIKRVYTDTTCICDQGEQIYPTDNLRTHERFYDNSSSEQAFTAFRIVTEHLLMINIIRYFHQTRPLEWFDQIAFVVDGPLAIFGMPAWLKDHIQAEITSVHSDLLSTGHAGLLLMGMEKSGEFLDHLEELDWDQSMGVRQRLPNGTTMAPTTDYIYRYIRPNPDTKKAYGEAVYYGRKLLYKSRAGQHAVVMTPIVNQAGRDRNGTDLSAFPRLGDALNIVDDLYTYLYRDGFIPLVRANAHAAIPLRQGQRILQNLFDEEPNHP
jgi:hypothetical protein